MATKTTPVERQYGAFNDPENNYPTDLGNIEPQEGVLLEMVDFFERHVLHPFPLSYRAIYHC